MLAKKIAMSFLDKKEGGQANNLVSALVRAMRTGNGTPNEKMHKVTLWVSGSMNRFGLMKVRATPRSSAKADHAPPRCRSTPKTRLTDAQDLDIALGNVF